MKNLSLKMKLLLLSGALLVISVAVGSVSFITLKGVISNYDKIVELSIPKQNDAYEMMLAYRSVRINLLTLTMNNLTKEQGDAALQAIEENTIKYEELEKDYQSYDPAPGQQEIFKDVHDSWLSFKTLAHQGKDLFKTGKAEDQAQLDKLLMTEGVEKAKVYTEDIHALLKFHQDITQARADKAQNEADIGNKTIFGIIVIGFIMGLGIAGVVASRLSSVLGAVARDLNHGADQVNQASQMIAESSQSLSQSSTEQASSLEETVATMEEMTAMVKLNTENGKQAASLAANTRDTALKGEQEIKTLIGSIFSISADSRKIEEIISVIDDIAFQTNLLALNASVEAARAGEQGKGFAVVAEAVRTLAQRSAIAAKDISELIKTSVDKIEVGARQAEQGGVVLGEIVTAVKKVADLNSEMSVATQEQSNGITQIGKALNQLDQTTQGNAAASEEAAAAAEELSAQSSSLKSNADILQQEVFGKAG